MAAQLCFICRRRAGGREAGIPCFFCARAVARAIVEQEPSWVLARWSVTDEFAEARTLALGSAPPRDADEAEEQARIGAGLAVGYVELGMRGAALITGALALTRGLSAYEGPAGTAAEVVFSTSILEARGRQLLAEEFGWGSSEPS